MEVLHFTAGFVFASLIYFLIFQSLFNKQHSGLYLKIGDLSRKIYRLFAMLKEARLRAVRESQRRQALEIQSKEKYLQGWKDHEAISKKSNISKIYIGPNTISNIKQLHTR